MLAILQLEGTRSRVRSHADDWLRHLANVNEARTEHPRNCIRGSITQNGLTDPVTLTFEPKTVALLGYSKVILYTKFEHFGIIRF